MNNTLIINDGNYDISMKVGEILSLILRLAKNIDVNYAPMDISNYNNVVLVFSTYESSTKENIKEYLAHIKYMIGDVKLAIICVGADEDIYSYLNEIYETIGRKSDVVEFINKKQSDKSSKMEDNKKTFNKRNHANYMIDNVNEADVIKACDNIYKFINNPKKKMPKEKLLSEITKFIKEHKTCALATGYKDFIRNTPMEYTYYNKNFYFITEGGMKFKGILQNDNVSIAIFNNYTSMDSILGIQICGKSSLVSNTSKEYLEVIEKNNIQIEVVENLPININIIRVIPENIEFTNSEFKKNGFDTKQIYSLATNI